MSEHATVGANCDIRPGATVGPEGQSGEPPVLGDDCTVRSGTVIYADVTVGDGLATGHGVLVREHTDIGDDCTVGTNTVIDGHTVVGDRVSMQTGVYVPTHTDIADDVFLGPNAVLTNDPYPIRGENDLEGPTLERHASVGANATILPGVTVGERSFVAAGSVVIDDVPPGTLAVGVPAEYRPLPEHLDRGNVIR
jgi:acetyltransferase-like isoleucine patch superfamily enzyme